MPIQVLYVQSTAEIGGTDISLLRTLQHLDKERFRTHVVLPKGGPFWNQYCGHGARVHFLISMRKLTSRQGLSYMLRYVLGYFPTVLALRRLILREKIKIVHSNSLHNWYGFLAAKWAGVPHVWHVREIVVQSAWIRKIEALLARHFSDRIIIMDDAIGESLFGSKKNYPPQVRKVYEGIDVQTFHPRTQPSRIRKECGIDEQATLVGAVSRLDPWKGVDIFIQAARIVHQKHPHVQFLVCGGEIDGHPGYEDRLKKLARDLGLARFMAFTGWRYKTEQMPEVYRALDLSVHCAIYPEPYGLVNIEAMASGLPVIATAHGGPLEICVDQKTALLVPPKDPEAMAQAILELLENPNKAKQMGEKGRLRAEEFFNMAQCIRNLEAVYAELVP